MVSGKCSAEGHQWTDASIVTDYIEKKYESLVQELRAMCRTMPWYMPQPALYGIMQCRMDVLPEYTEKHQNQSSRIKQPGSDVYNKYKNGEKVEFTNSTTIEPVRKILSPTYPSYGNHEFTDAMRADELIKELKQFESLEGDKPAGTYGPLPYLMIIQQV